MIRAAASGVGGSSGVIRIQLIIILRCLRCAAILTTDSRFNEPLLYQATPCFFDRVQYIISVGKFSLLLVGIPAVFTTSHAVLCMFLLFFGGDVTRTNARCKAVELRCWRPKCRSIFAKGRRSLWGNLDTPGEACVFVAYLGETYSVTFWFWFSPQLFVPVLKCNVN